ncbi:YdiU family protein [Nitrosomonas sp. JL21]|uniref:protein adenylyltransferase SelO n=1 Tax=Nitrosomonas sp. JL21 TaxID=153949 RepID=UPI0013709DC2|nr:YdiU family protein [Nitrosomonas sp. JL21]MBL8497959.1 YdiU family protein [Nitrosomonas sp.]MCC7090609.1 YdiU family protein [Nitrosomonas sp.]MXS78300.1 YdiU family protein [Nitrosomonas sp. JL21]
MKDNTATKHSEANTQSVNPNVGWHFDHSYERLPDYFYARLTPVPVQAPQVVVLNHALAASLGLNLRVLSEQETAALFSGNVLPDPAHPIAQAYAGHQFGHFTMLGDGRAILLGEHLTPTGKRFDIQFKGSGQTPFSRRGDGRAALAPMLREYIVSEAMHALNIPTTRSLAVVKTGEWVMREKPLPGAILTRVAASHIRVGTFQYAAGQGNDTAIKILADYVIQRHYSDLKDAENPYLSLLNHVIERQASLVAQWMLVGFIHGVMNTDNMSISGETIDYGPCAFIDSYDPTTVFSSIDQHGRYRYSNQPLMAQWNLARFAETLLPLLDSSQDKAVALAEEAIHAFPQHYQNQWISGMRRKLGLLNEEAGDAELIATLLNWMTQQKTDYTNLFRALSADGPAEEIAPHNAEFLTWHAKWKSRLLRQPGSMDNVHHIMQQSNPAIIPRNHRVEEALSAASDHGDLSPMKRLLAAVADPFADLPEFNDLRTPPAPSERIYQTFCGT